MLYFRDYTFITDEGVYEPAEDSILLADNLSVDEGDVVLDLGTGTGIQAIAAASKAERVLAVDINPAALKLAERNAELNRVGNIEFRVSDLFRDIKGKEKFDLILFNPPYLPVEGGDMLDLAWSGGEGGVREINRFIDSASKHLESGGRMQFIVSSLNPLQDIIGRLEKKGFTVEVGAEKKLSFERLYLLLCFKDSCR